MADAPDDLLLADAPTGAQRSARPPAASASASAATTAAVVVVYRRRGDLGPLLRTLRRSTQHVVVVDNAERGDPGLQRLACEAGADLIANRNRGALAGAYNSAIAHLAATQPRCTQIVFIDEDSDASVLGRFIADPDVQCLLRDPATAAVAPVYRDRATQLRGKHLCWIGQRLRWLPREFDGASPAAFVINSMAVWRVDALRAIGPFDEGLGVDHVDTDACLRARAAGLAVWVHGSYEFAHSIGERRRFTLFGRELQAGGHAPPRRFQIARNTTWLARRWWRTAPAFALLCASRIAYEAVGIVAAENRKPAKLWALVRGAAAGLFNLSLR